MKKEAILNFVKYKKDRNYKKLINDFLPVFERFVALSEQHVFNGDFSEHMLEIRNFCLLNYLRMIFAEVEDRSQYGEFSADILKKEYSKVLEEMKNFKETVQELYVPKL